MRLVPSSARALALVLSIGSLSFAFAGDAAPAVLGGAMGADARPPILPGGPRASTDIVPRTDASDAAAAAARRRRAARAKARLEARRAARARLLKARRAARERAARRRLARLPATKRAGFRWPAQGWITSGMGPRGNGYHHGTDIACRKGSPIRASKRGRVVFVKNLTIYGKTVVIQHANGYSTLYAHMKRVHTRVGRVVRTRQAIGQCGSTGRSTGPHLHFELRRNGRFLKPGHYLPSRG